MKDNPGLLYAIGAYTWWGVIPIFWKQLDHVSAIEIVMHRMVWACLLVLALIVMLRQWKAFIVIFKDVKVLLKLLLASALMAVNWGIFIWAVNTGQIVETSLGYFINPLITVLFGVVIFSERLRRGQIIALVIAGIGVVTLVLAHGQLPMVALSLAITFALYSVIKKTVTVPAIHGMAVETTFMFFPALIYLLYAGARGQGVFGVDLVTDGMLILSGLFTLIPLMMFAAAAKKISLTALGMSQYIGPFMQLAIGVLMYNEPFGSERMIAFGLVWVALMVYTVDQLGHSRKNRLARRVLG